MYYYDVAPNQIVRIDSDSFTYTYPAPLQIGQIVSIEVGKKQLIGVILQEVPKPDYETKEILSVIESSPLPGPLISLAEWISRYYKAPLATVWQTILPSGLQKKRRQLPLQQKHAKRKRTNIVFNEEQKTALKIIDEYENGTFLLHGVTGSGKTEIYIELARKALVSGKSAIVLVPEIALTSQLVAEFSNHFDNLIVTHSKMTESNRHNAWKTVLDSTTPLVVLGPRSALFAPLSNIGVIIVDEAHEPSFKQEQTPKYSALRAATVLGRLHAANVIFGSATPSVTDRYLAEKSERPILRLTKLAREYGIPAKISVVDMKARTNFKTHRFLSDKLLKEIGETLENQKQTLIFHNRRGSASTTLCQGCGWTAECPTCFLPLALHSDDHELRCHICNYKTNVSTSCPTCHGIDIIHKGIGTKLIESELRKIFPKANIVRFDADNAPDDTLENRYQDLYDGKIDIVIGTQIVAKGLDLPNLRTVGVVQADAGLSLPDFTSNERTFQLLAQVVGRVGRDRYQTTVIVQSYQPTHPSVVFGLNQDYESFYENTLIERQRALFPPFTHLLKLVCVYKTERTAIINSRKIADELREKVNKNVKILGPAPAFYERSSGTYRWQLTLKSPKREYLIEALKYLPPANWQFDLDPTSLL